MTQALYPLSCLTLLVVLGCGPTPTPVQPVTVPVSAASTTVTTQPRTWLAYGDSITDDAFRDPVVWQASFPEAAPRAINSGMRGATSTNALSKLNEVLAAYAGVQHAGVAFGTNDAYMEMPVAEYKANLRDLVTRLRASGVTPMLATVPYSPHPRMAKLEAYNAAIREVEREFELPAGPDLYQWFREHPEQVSGDQIHMTEAGSEAIQRLWAEKARTLNW